MNKSLITVLKHALPLRNQLKFLTKIDPLKHSMGLTKYWASRYFAGIPSNAADKFDRNEFEQPPVGLW
jgi:hypothetical protein